MQLLASFYPRLLLMPASLFINQKCITWLLAGMPTTIKIANRCFSHYVVIKLKNNSFANADGSQLRVKRRLKTELLNGFQFWLAGYVIFLFLIGSEHAAKIYFYPFWLRQYNLLSCKTFKNNYINGKPCTVPGGRQP